MTTTPTNKRTDSSNFSFIVNSGLIGMADGKSKSDIRNVVVVVVVVVANAFDHHRASALFSDDNVTTSFPRCLFLLAPPPAVNASTVEKERQTNAKTTKLRQFITVIVINCHQ